MGRVKFPPSPRIVFLGLNRLGTRIHDWLLGEGERILCVVTHPRELEVIHRLKPELVLSCGFRYVVPERILRIPALGCLNLHTSYLPYNRGTFCNVWSLIEGTPAGVTLHSMVARTDEGPIVAQIQVPTSPEDTGKTLFVKLERAGFELFTRTWPRIRRGKIARKPQDPAAGTRHTDREFQDLMEIDLDRSYHGRDLINRLRALTYPPYDNAYFRVKGKRYYLRLDIYQVASASATGRRESPLTSHDA